MRTRLMLCAAAFASLTLSACSESKEKQEARILKYFQIERAYEETSVKNKIKTGQFKIPQKSLADFKKIYGRPFVKPDYKELNLEYGKTFEIIHELKKQIALLEDQRHKHMIATFEHRKQYPVNQLRFRKTKTPEELERLKAEEKALFSLIKDDEAELKKLYNLQNKAEETANSRRDEIKAKKQKLELEYLKDIDNLYPLIKAVVFEQNGISNDFIRELKSDPLKMQEAEEIRAKHDMLEIFGAGK